jgi:TatA/E family protein of Tat protein translocase
MGPLGFQEMVVIFIVALLVFGPKKLPDLGKSLGKGIREFRKQTDELKQTWEEQVREVQDPVKDITREIRQAGNDMKSDFYGSEEPSQTATSTEPASCADPQKSAEPTTPSETTVPKEHV